MTYSGDHNDFSGADIQGDAIGSKVEHHHHYGAAPTATSALPAAPAVFTGRDIHIAALLDTLNPHIRSESEPVLISAVAGLGGIGKTALALHTAHAARERGWFPGGTLFIDLHGYDDTPATADQAVLSLLRALGIRDTELPPTPDEQYGLFRSVFTQLADAHKPALLVLDNASDPAQIAPLLPGGSGHRVLVTSRDSLDSLPARLINLDALEPDDAITLIQRSLQLADPTDQRTAHEPTATLHLAALCGHLPLALQIAAAQLRRRQHRPIASLVTELQAAADRLRALHTRGVDQYGRPLALRPVFDVTYQRLEADEARLFRLLALTPAPDFGTRTAAAMADLPEVGVLALLDELAAAFLITPSPDGERWRMHDLVRVYARTVVVEGDVELRQEAEAARGRMLAFYVEWALAADDHLRALPGDGAPELFGGREQALAWLDTERAGLVGAALWVEDPVHAEAAFQLGMCLGEYLNFRRYFGDFAVVMEAARDAAERVGNRHGEAGTWNNLGLALRGLRRFEEAAEAHTRAQDIYAALGDRHREAGAWDNLGFALLEVRRFEEAAEAHTRAQDVFVELGDRHGEAMAWNNLGLALRELRRFEDAAEAHTRAQDIYAELGDRHGEAGAWGNLGLALRGLRRFEEAVAAHTRAQDIYAELGDRHREAMAWNSLGNALRKLRRFSEAVDAYRYGEILFVEVGDWYTVGDTRWNIALVFEDQQRASEAKAAWAAAADAYTQVGATDEAAEARQKAE